MNQQYSGILDNAGKKYLEETVMFQVKNVIQVDLCVLDDL